MEILVLVTDPFGSAHQEKLIVSTVIVTANQFTTFFIYTWNSSAVFISDFAFATAMIYLQNLPN